MHSDDSGYGKQKPRSDSLQKYRARLYDFELQISGSGRCFGESNHSQLSTAQAALYPLSLLYQHRVGGFLGGAVVPSQQNPLLETHPTLI